MEKEATLSSMQQEILKGFYEWTEIILKIKEDNILAGAKEHS